MSLNFQRNSKSKNNSGLRILDLQHSMKLKGVAALSFTPLSRYFLSIEGSCHAIFVNVSTVPFPVLPLTTVVGIYFCIMQGSFLQDVSAGT